MKESLALYPPFPASTIKMGFKTKLAKIGLKFAGLFPKLTARLAAWRIKRAAKKAGASVRDRTSEWLPI